MILISQLVIYKSQIINHQLHRIYESGVDITFQKKKEKKKRIVLVTFGSGVVTRPAKLKIHWKKKMQGGMGFAHDVGKALV